MSEPTEVRPFRVGGREARPRGDGATTPIEVTDKHTGAVLARVHAPDAAAVDEAVARAYAARDAMRRMPSYARRAALEHVARGLEARRTEATELVRAEAGKPIRDARAEVDRALLTLRVAAEEAVRLDGAAPTLDVTPRAHGRRGLVQRVPVGVCALISSFNFPLNLMLHKVAPALAAGCPFVMKPSERTPLSSLLLGDLLAGAGLPEGAFSVLPARAQETVRLVEDPRIALVSFTGSERVGWDLQARARGKRVVLELGGNAPCIVDADPGADLDAVADRIVAGAYGQSGQSCISVQRILAHAHVAEALRERLVARARAVQCGDPRDEATVVGPLIDAAAAERVAAWIDDAIARGARLLVGGPRVGNLVPATLIEDVPEDHPLEAEEVFGPVATLRVVHSFDEALERANAGRFGLQAGVFTGDLRHALRAFDTLEFGGVIVGDVPTFRVDSMPYGGVKRSGLGREGIAASIAEMTEPRLLVLSDPAR
jgi:acyl-CoA reductase-like NAD-dependent aldehyde dehydrogenase